MNSRYFVISKINKQIALYFLLWMYIKSSDADMLDMNENMSTLLWVDDRRGFLSHGFLYYPIRWWFTKIILKINNIII